MKVRTIAGLGMALVAAGLLLIYFLGSDSGGPSEPESGRPLAPSGQLADAVGGDAEVAEFLADYNASYRRLRTDANTATWYAATSATAANLSAAAAAERSVGDFTGDRTRVEQLRDLRGRPGLSDLEDRQIEAAWRLAARSPGALASVVDQTLSLESALIDSLEGFPYRDLAGTEAAEGGAALDEILASSDDPVARRTAWENRRRPGPRSKDGMLQLRDLRNRTARSMGYSSFFGLEAADYGLTSAELMSLLADLATEIRPLYRQLHCWVKHELAHRFGAEPPRLIPVHWLADPWGEQWPGVVEAPDRDELLADVQPQWILEQAEQFTLSLGFDPLPLTYWGESDLFPLPPGSHREKQAGTAAWHIDLEQDLRSLMNVRNDFASFTGVHGEMARLQGFGACARPEVPALLRTGSCRAMPAALAGVLATAAAMDSYLRLTGLLRPEEAPAGIQRLIHEALTGPVTLLPYALGTAAHWEHDFYEQDLPRHQINTRWWSYAAEFQGIEPPVVRGEDYCDPATNRFLIAEPARSYDAAVAQLIRYQLHRYICAGILGQDLHEAEYFGNRSVGEFLHSIMAPGATRGWDVILRQATGEDLSAAAMIEYFAPLQAWLETQNQGRIVDFDSAGG